MLTHTEDLDVKEPSLDLVGKNVVLKFTGGIGDIVIAIGSTARTLAGKVDRLTAAVLPHQIELVRNFVGIDDVISATALNDPNVRKRYDSVFNFSGVLNNSKYIRKGNYYDLVAKKVGFPVELCKLQNIEYAPATYKDRPIVAIHTGASNPNRRWSDIRWHRLALYLSFAGYSVWFFGTKNEFGISGEYYKKLSDFRDNLWWQTLQLAKCSYFLGTDSGFCHLAGVLGVPGKVLFTSTDPMSVLHRYSNLNAISPFSEKLGLLPSLSLNKDDEMAKRCQEALTLESVLDQIPHCAIIAQTKKTYRIAVCGSDEWKDELLPHLEGFKVCGVSEDITKLSWLAPDAILSKESFDKLKVCHVLLRNGKEASFAVESPDISSRALREILLGLG